MPDIAVDHLLTPDDRDKALREDVWTGLRTRPKALPPKWFYDERGSALFDQITELPEYYPTRREREILARRAEEIAGITEAVTLLELGAGSGDKTRLLLDALRGAGTLRRYVPVDVSGAYLTTAARRLATAYPSLRVHAVVADFEIHLHHLPQGGRRLIAFLGSTIGNLLPQERGEFLGRLRAAMEDTDFLLLGADLIKDPDRLLRAYDDGQGITAAFNRNVLSVINRQLGADFIPEMYQHVAVWNADQEWIEMRLRACRDQRATIPALDLTVWFTEGEDLRTEVSAKFRPSRLASELNAAGLALYRMWTDPAGDFAVCLARPA